MSSPDAAAQEIYDDAYAESKALASDDPLQDVTVPSDPGPALLRAQKRRPSPSWYGGVMIIGGLGSMAVILLTYTLLDWGPQQRLGAWNYWVVIGLIPVISVLMRRWEPDQRI